MFCRDAEAVVLPDRDVLRARRSSHQDNSGIRADEVIFGSQRLVDCRHEARQVRRADQKHHVVPSDDVRNIENVLIVHQPEAEFGIVAVGICEDPGIQLLGLGTGKSKSFPRLRAGNDQGFRRRDFIMCLVFQRQNAGVDDTHELLEALGMDMDDHVIRTQQPMNEIDMSVGGSAQRLSTSSTLPDMLAVPPLAADEVLIRTSALDRGGYS